MRISPGSEAVAIGISTSLEEPATASTLGAEDADEPVKDQAHLQPVIYGFSDGSLRPGAAYIIDPEGRLVACSPVAGPGEAMVVHRIPDL